MLPVLVARDWRGVSREGSVLDPNTDYGRACAITRPIGVLQVAGAEAVVFGPSPPMSAWGPSSDNRGTDVFIIEDWATDEVDSLLSVASHATELQDTHIVWRLPEGGVYLMSAADTATDPSYEPKWIPLPEGRCSIVTATVTNADGTVTLYRLSPLE